MNVQTNQDLRIERRGAALWLTIDREDRRNAITSGVLEGIAQGIEEAQRDETLRAIVLTGSGTKAFCAGADLQDGKMFELDPSRPHHALAQLLRKARQCPVPLVARVNGACVAGGMALLAMCDLAVAAEHAVFGLPEVKIGVFPAQVLAMIQHQLPRRVLARLCLTGQPVAAAQALAVGLVNDVSSDVDGALSVLLNELFNASPAALRRGLYTMKSIEAMSFEESMSFTESQIALFAATADAKEGQAAFREKRKPIWAVA